MYLHGTDFSSKFLGTFFLSFKNIYFKTQKLYSIDH